LNPHGDAALRLIGAIDLLGGRAVHARGGRREHYVAVDAVAGSVISGDAVALARRYAELGVNDFYVADLNAIGGAPPQDALVAALSALGPPVWLDAGATSAEQARQCLALGADRVIVGLETLASWEALRAICAAAGRERVAFSLDLREGTPIGTAAGLASGRPEALAARAADAGAGAILVLDLARVGQSTGLDIQLLVRVRSAVPGVMLVAGGGVRGREDLDRLADSGCDAALVATALHTGALPVDHGSVTR
jgi:phosphoribosylformimino-5-aminoimidazole carboxamide ribotide isomerase